MKKTLTKLFAFLGKGLSEDNQNPSYLRIIGFYVFIILIPCVAFTLIYVVLQYENIVVAVLAAVLAFLTSVLGIKAYQKGKESASLSTGVKDEVQS